MEEKKETAAPKPPKQTFYLKKELKTEKKTYKPGDKYSHSNESVIAYLKTNKYI